MTTEINKTKRNILVELRIKGYTERFLKDFLIFFKQRFFRYVTTKEIIARIFDASTGKTQKNTKKLLFFMKK